MCLDVHHVFNDVAVLLAECLLIRINFFVLIVLLAERLDVQFAMDGCARLEGLIV